MFKKHFFLAFALFLCCFLFAQNGEAQRGYYDSLSGRFNTLITHQSFDSALVVAKEMNSYVLHVESDTSLRYALSFRYIGFLFAQLQLMDSAIAYYHLSRDILQRQDRVNHTDYAKTLVNLGALLEEMGDYKEAIPCYLQALQIRKIIYGNAHNDYIEILSRLGVLNYRLGEFQMSESYYQQAVQALGENAKHHEYFVKNMINLGVLFYELGDYKNAEWHYREALQTQRELLGENHPDYAIILNNLGTLYVEMRDMRKAEDHFNRAKEIFSLEKGKGLKNYAYTLNNLGILYKTEGNYEKAFPYYQSAMEIRKEILGFQHPDLADGLHSYGELYELMGNDDMALNHFNQALDIYAKVCGKEHPKYIMCEIDIAELLVRNRREKEAFELFKKNYYIKSKQINDYFEWLTDSQKEVYWKKESVFFNKIIQFASSYSQIIPEAAELTYNSVLITKGKLLEAKISTENYYREVEGIREELANRRRRIAKLESDVAESPDVKVKLDQLSKEADSLDKRLTLTWPEYALQKRNLSISWNQIQQNLATDEAAIEFVRYQNEVDSQYYYLALVLRKQDIHPILVKLCKEQDLYINYSKTNFGAYYSLIWEPLDSLLGDVKNIYYSPVGELNNISFQALFRSNSQKNETIAKKTLKRGIVISHNEEILTENTTFLLDRYSLHQLTSTRYLAMDLKQKEKGGMEKTIALIGGVNYDYLPDVDGSKEMVNKRKKQATNSPPEKDESRFSFLPGTEVELRKIALLVAENDWTSNILANNDASEDNVIKLEGKDAKSILHFATHGYSYPAFDYSDSSVTQRTLRYSLRFKSNPMVRSGLILAGGNWAWTGNDTLLKSGAQQNGILTALEVSHLNLKNTKLAVLSACETGLGKINGSEGTFGLKRGFKLAGVEQMVVSLWPVNDQETMELMTLFYDDMMKTLNPVISFEKAQKQMRNKYPIEPEKWAGFVLVR